MRDSEKEAVEEKRNRRIGEFLSSLDQGGGVGTLEEGVLTGLTVRLPTELEPSALLVVKAMGAGGAVVAFVGAYRLSEAILAWRARSGADKMKWREDVPWKER